MHDLFKLQMPYYGSSCILSKRQSLILLPTFQIQLHGELIKDICYKTILKIQLEASVKSDT